MFRIAFFNQMTLLFLNISGLNVQQKFDKKVIIWRQRVKCIPGIISLKSMKLLQRILFAVVFLKQRKKILEDDFMEHFI